MSSDVWVAVVGTVAAVCTTVAFVPQIVKIRRQGGRDVSYAMLALYLAGVLLWLVYGVLVEAAAVIAANLAAALLVSAALVVKRLAGARAPVASRREGQRPRIAIDMDEVLADSLGKHLRACNRMLGTDLTRGDLAGRGLEDCVPAGDAARVQALVHEPGFFEDLDVIEGSREAVLELTRHYEVFIASAAMEVPNSLAAKYRWLRRHFPFIPPSHVVFCGDKSVLDADYLIDDTPRQLRRFRGTPVLFSAPHNRDAAGYLRAADWDEVRRLLLPSEGASPGRAEASARGVRGLGRPPVATSEPRPEAGRV